jgi:hypothetical protein
MKDELEKAKELVNSLAEDAKKKLNETGEKVKEFDIKGKLDLLKTELTAKGEKIKEAGKEFIEKIKK